MTTETFDDHIDSGARSLARMLATGTYTAGIEHNLATIAVNSHINRSDPADIQAQALETILEECVDAHVGEVIGTQCLIDECDETSYQAVAEMTKILLTTIRAQGRQQIAVDELVTHEIVRRSHWVTHAPAAGH